MRSMTGFGRATAQIDGREATLELKAVNHRFLDIGLRIPRSFGFLEENLRRMLGETCQRGHVDVFIAYRNMRNDARVVLFDEALARAYAQVFEKMGGILNTQESMTLERLSQMPDVLTVREQEEDREAVIALIEEVYREAAAQLVASREAEGRRLRGDFEARLKAIEDNLHSIEESATCNAASYQKKLLERINELLSDVPLDPARIAQEAAIIADRAAIDEETVRLSGHITSMRETLAQEGPLGRRLDFIVQEMNRETNTIGSKSTDMAITQCVLNIKGELEKIREQVQNIE